MVIRVKLEGNTEGWEVFVNVAVGCGRKKSQDDVARGAWIDCKCSYPSSSWNHSQCCIHIANLLGRGCLKQVCWCRASKVNHISQGLCGMLGLRSF